MPHEAALLKLIYLTAAVLFIFGLKGLSHPRSAVRGNLLAATGMLLAIVVTLADQRIVDFRIIIAGFVVGGLFGAILAYRAPMTAMPQVVAIFNGLGGGASALAVGAAFEEALRGEWIEAITIQFSASAAAAALVGAVAFTGSGVAFGKLQGWIGERPVLLRGRHVVNITLLVLCVFLSAWHVWGYTPFLFGSSPSAAAELSRGELGAELRQAFQTNGIELSSELHIKPAGENQWDITDATNK
ncbi:MAG: NAD(P)(+) transhydrogenase (Re/Si-specific) subunit beta, partial [Nevskiales bacterium]